jgi:hypothetical protein
LNLVYVNRSILECVDAATPGANPETALAVCDLKADGRTLILLLSVLTVRPTAIPCEPVVGCSGLLVDYALRHSRVSRRRCLP